MRPWMNRSEDSSPDSRALDNIPKCPSPSITIAFGCVDPSLTLLAPSLFLISLTAYELRTNVKFLTDEPLAAADVANATMASLAFLWFSLLQVRYVFEWVIIFKTTEVF
ncbi:hypothetical protein BKA67DRAFT_90384 [Truncatella angustata]|uniref:Uncharacterized protein n=1 Tax=Truncatella angustata TaxID=152316 RepID=A0A9P8RHI4_9PEZI|nr:uncharacterized protein BKA67DRAFT_90384 [Truncatella angustata]KAH6645957.1 hypothetical protein BKA67DRAFT_90384 [Truncatella angustata]